MKTNATLRFQHQASMTTSFNYVHFNCYKSNHRYLQPLHSCDVSNYLSPTYILQAFLALPTMGSIFPILPPLSSVTDFANYLFPSNHSRVSDHSLLNLLPGAVDSPSRPRILSIVYFCNAFLCGRW